MEAGATRLFETRRLNATLEKEEKEKREKDAKENPMAALEKRTQGFIFYSFLTLSMSF